MKLTQKAIEALNDRSLVLRLALALDFTEVWIMRLIQKNKENGPLTTGKALMVIREATGLSESDILCEEVKEEVQR